MQNDARRITNLEVFFHFFVVFSFQVTRAVLGRVVSKEIPGVEVVVVHQVRVEEYSAERCDRRGVKRTVRNVRGGEKWELKRRRLGRCSHGIKRVVHTCRVSELGVVTDRERIDGFEMSKGRGVS